MNICVPKATYSLLMVVTHNHIFPLPGFDINGKAAQEKQGVVPSCASPIHSEWLTVRVKPRQFMQNSATANPSPET